MADPEPDEKKTKGETSVTVTKGLGPDSDLDLLTRMWSANQVCIYAAQQVDLRKAEVKLAKSRLDEAKAGKQEADSRRHRVDAELMDYMRHRSPNDDTLRELKERSEELAIREKAVTEEAKHVKEALDNPLPMPPWLPGVDSGSSAGAGEAGATPADDHTGDGDEKPQGEGNGPEAT